MSGAKTPVLATESRAMATASELYEGANTQKKEKNMTDNQQANLIEPSRLLHCTTQRTHAGLFFGERRRLFPLPPTAMERVLVRVRVCEKQSSTMGIGGGN